MILLFVLALSWLAAAVGLLAGSVEAANSFTFVLMFLPYVSTAFVPAQTLPAGMRGFAEHQPFTPIMETMRGLWMGHTSTGAGVGHEAWLGGRLVRGHPRRVVRRGVLAVPAPDGRLTQSRRHALAAAVVRLAGAARGFTRAYIRACLPSPGLRRSTSNSVVAVIRSLSLP